MDHHAAKDGGPTGCSRNSKEVATPKFPPPPRNAQNRSLCSSALAVKHWLSAVTRSTDSTLSQAKPCLPVSQTSPPPSVRPPIPVLETVPPVVASPKACVSRSKSAHKRPPWACAVR